MSTQAEKPQPSQEQAKIKDYRKEYLNLIGQKKLSDPDFKEFKSKKNFNDVKASIDLKKPKDYSQKDLKNLFKNFAEKAYSSKGAQACQIADMTIAFEESAKKSTDKGREKESGSDRLARFAKSNDLNLNKLELVVNGNNAFIQGYSKDGETAMVLAQFTLKSEARAQMEAKADKISDDTVADEQAHSEAVGEEAMDPRIVTRNGKPVAYAESGSCDTGSTCDIPEGNESPKWLLGIEHQKGTVLSLNEHKNKALQIIANILYRNPENAVLIITGTGCKHCKEAESKNIYANFAKEHPNLNVVQYELNTGTLEKPASVSGMPDLGILAKMRDLGIAGTPLIIFPRNNNLEGYLDPNEISPNTPETPRTLGSLKGPLPDGSTISVEFRCQSEEVKQKQGESMIKSIEAFMRIREVDIKKEPDIKKLRSRLEILSGRKILIDKITVTPKSGNPVEVSFNSDKATQQTGEPVSSATEKQSKKLENINQTVKHLGPSGLNVTGFDKNNPIKFTWEGLEFNIYRGYENFLSDTTRYTAKYKGEDIDLAIELEPDKDKRFRIVGDGTNSTAEEAKYKLKYKINQINNRDKWVDASYVFKTSDNVQVEVLWKQKGELESTFLDWAELQRALEDKSNRTEAKIREIAGKYEKQYNGDLVVNKIRLIPTDEHPIIIDLTQDQTAASATSEQKREALDFIQREIQSLKAESDIEITLGKTTISETATVTDLSEAKKSILEFKDLQDDIDILYERLLKFDISTPEKSLNSAKEANKIKYIKGVSAQINEIVMRIKGTIGLEINEIVFTKPIPFTWKSENSLGFSGSDEDTIALIKTCKDNQNAVELAKAREEADRIKAAQTKAREDQESALRDQENRLITSIGISGLRLTIKKNIPEDTREGSTWQLMVAGIKKINAILKGEVEGDKNDIKHQISIATKIYEYISFIDFGNIKYDTTRHSNENEFGFDQAELAKVLSRETALEKKADEIRTEVLRLLQLFNPSITELTKNTEVTINELTFKYDNSGIYNTDPLNDKQWIDDVISYGCFRMKAKTNFGEIDIAFYSNAPYGIDIVPIGWNKGGRPIPLNDHAPRGKTKSGIEDAIKQYQEALSQEESSESDIVSTHKARALERLRVFKEDMTESDLENGLFQFEIEGVSFKSIDLPLTENQWKNTGTTIKFRGVYGAGDTPIIIAINLNPDNPYAEPNEHEIKNKAGLINYIKNKKLNIDKADRVETIVKDLKELGATNFDDKNPSRFTLNGHIFEADSFSDGAPYSRSQEPYIAKINGKELEFVIVTRDGKVGRYIVDGTIYSSSAHVLEALEALEGKQEFKGPTFVGVDKATSLDEKYRITFSNPNNFETTAVFRFYNFKAQSWRELELPNKKKPNNNFSLSSTAKDDFENDELDSAGKIKWELQFVNGDKKSKVLKINEQVIDPSLLPKPESQSQPETDEARMNRHKQTVINNFKTIGIDLADINENTEFNFEDLPFKANSTLQKNLSAKENGIAWFSVSFNGHDIAIGSETEQPALLGYDYETETRIPLTSKQAVIDFVNSQKAKYAPAQVEEPTNPPSEAALASTPVDKDISACKTRTELDKAFATKAAELIKAGKNKNSPEYKMLEAQAQNRIYELRLVSSRTETFKNLKTNLKYLKSDPFKINSSLAKLNEEEFMKFWSDFRGPKKAVESLIQKLFPGTSRESVPKMIFGIIDKGKSANVYLTDVLSEEEIDNANEERIQDAVELLHALTYLTYSPVDKVTRDEEIAALPQEQRQIRVGLNKLVNKKEKPATKWDRLLFWLGDGKKDITLADVDRKTVTLNEGSFQRHFNPYSVVDNIINTQGLYTINEQGQAIVDRQKLGEQLNKYIDKGNAYRSIQGGSPAPHIDVLGWQSEDPEQINLSDDQILAFQAGYLIDEQSKVDTQINTAKKILTDVENPASKAFLEFLISKNVPLDTVGKVKEQMIGGILAGISMENGEIKGLDMGAGASIKLDDRFTLSVAGGGTAPLNGGEGGGTGAVALTVRLFDSQGMYGTLDFTVGLSAQGGFVGIKEKVSVFEISGGMNFGFKGGIAGGIGIMVDITNNQNKLDRESREAENKDKNSALWDAWRQLGAVDTNAKFEALARINGFEQIIKNLKDNYSLTNEDIVHLFEQVKDEVIFDAQNNLSFNLVQRVGVFAGVTGTSIGGIPVAEFNIGSVMVTIPNRKEISRLINEASDVNTTNKIEAAVARLDKALVQGAQALGTFQEQTPGLTYSLSREGQLVGVLDKKEVDLSGLATAADYNKAMANAELRLDRQGDRYELKVLNSEFKDIEIHIDPTMKAWIANNAKGENGFSIVQEGGRVFLLGNLDGIVISRERFKFPMQLSEDGPSIRDIITIRNRASLDGKRNRQWIEKNESAFLGQTAGERGFHTEFGNQYNYKYQENLVSDDYAFYRDRQEAFRETQGELTPEQIKTMESEINARWEAIGSIEKRTYDKQELRSGLLSTLDNLYTFNTAFKKEVTSSGIIDNPKRILETIIKHESSLNNMNNREANTAILKILDRHYTDLLKNNPSKEELSRRIKQRSEAVERKVIKPMFAAAARRMNLPLNINTDPLAHKFMETIYGFDYTNPENFKKMGMIPQGAMLFIGTKDNNFKGALSNTAAFEFSNYEFIKDSIKQFDLNSPDQDTRNIARILLEIASPIPGPLTEFLYSPLAIKIGNLQACRLLMSKENYNKVTEVYKNRSLLRDSEYKTAVQEFQKLVREIRAAQLEGKPFEKYVSEYGVTIRIDMKTNIVGGAYAKCANASFYVQEVGQVTIFRGANAVSIYTESTETLDAKQTKQAVNITTAVVVRNTTVETPTEEGPSKISGQGAEEASNKSGIQGASEPATGTSGDTYVVTPE